MVEKVKNGALKYDASTIQVLEGLEAVRRRPGMYVGGTDVRALHHLVYEVVDNSIDEALAGICDHIRVIIHPDLSVSVIDNGRGIPVGIHPEKGISALQLVLTTLHAGGKFGDGGYKVSGGLHGVGVSAVNALSEWMEVTVRVEGKIHRQRYERGIPVTDVEVIGKTDEDDTGTTVTFRFDPTIFHEVDYSFATLAQRFREMAFVTRGVTIDLIDQRPQNFPQQMSFYFEGGILSFVKYLNRNRSELHPPIFVEKEIDNVVVEVALQYSDSYSETVLAFANTINTIDGGAHLTGFRSALTRTINDVGHKLGTLKDSDPNLTGDDVREGLTAVVSVKVPDPQFESQTKVKLMNPEVKSAVESAVSEALSEYFETDSRAARRIVDKGLTASKARAAARKARDLVIRKSVLESMTLPGKLADCSSRDANNSELFIVEGDSAGGCFSGDTQVALADGRNLSFEALVAEQAAGKEHFCYTVRRDGTIGLERILHARCTKHDAEVIRITLDNGETIDCTPDHQFMMRDGSYREAETLVPGDSLMPLYRKLSDTSEPNITIDGYEMVWSPRSETWLFTHLLADWYNRWQSVYSEADGDRFDTFCERYFEGDEQAAVEAVRFHNHRVVSVERLSERVDVYDIEVPHTHNFALASGVFVHNSAKQGRDRHFQAILPLRGKILNTERASLDRILNNKEVQAIISALGSGVGDQFNVENLRYNRVIIMTDADVDGAHITTLLLTFFFRYMQPLIDHGHLYIAQPPLYLVKSGRDAQYVYTEAGLKRALKEIGDSKFNLQRYKGLGEMNPQQLWDTTMDPTQRTLVQVTIEDAAEADQVFSMLMGSEVPPRRRFIQSHAREVQNLDV